MTTEDIEKALEAELTRVQAALVALRGGVVVAAIDRNGDHRHGIGGGGKRTISAAGRAKIAAAQKRRWAKRRKQLKAEVAH